MNTVKLVLNGTAQIDGPLTQWDKGQTVAFVELTSDIDLTNCNVYWAYPHLSTLDPPQETEKREITLTKDSDNHPTGGTCTIPNNALVEAGEITGYIYHESGGTGETIAVITANVESANRPEDRTSSDYIPTVVEVVNNAINDKLPNADTLNNITADDNGNPLYDGKPLGGAAIIVDTVADLPPNVPDGSMAIVRNVYTKSDFRRPTFEVGNRSNHVLKSLYINPKISKPNFSELGISNISVTAYIGQFFTSLGTDEVLLYPSSSYIITYSPAEDGAPAYFVHTATEDGSDIYLCYMDSYTSGGETLTAGEWYLVTEFTGDIPSGFEKKTPVFPDRLYYAIIGDKDSDQNNYKLFEPIFSDAPYTNVWYDKIDGLWIRRR